MRIVSVLGRLVRDPATRRPVDETGIDVEPTDLHWARLLADGDVAIVTDDAAPAPKIPARSAPVQEA